MSNLTAARFSGDATLEAVYDGERLLRVGDRGRAVETLQRALIDAGVPLPRYGADGVYGAETKVAVEAFQRDSELTGREVDGIVGPTTMGLLDQRFAAEPAPGGTDDDAASIARAFELYRGRCDCGERLENNCAHYLSDAFIRAGYGELDGGTGAKYRRFNGRVVCTEGRPVRAREMREWFRERATDIHEGEPSDERYWTVFQHDADEYWGGHVVIHEHDGTGYDHRGTGDYPRWETQEHYTW